MTGNIPSSIATVATTGIFSAGENFTKADVERAFVYYLSGDMRWKTEFPWARVEKKPWWKLW